MADPTASELSQLGHADGTPFASHEGMKRRVLLSLVAITALTLGGVAYYRSTASAEAPRYLTVAVTRGDVVLTVEATGTLEAVTTVQVGSQVSGTIQSLHADFNSVVKRGQVVARLDPSLLQAQVEQAEATIVRLNADVERARVTLDDAVVKLRRAQELFRQQLVARMDVESAEATAAQAEASLKAAQAQVTQARASLNQNRVNLSHTIITAPVDGIVISRNVDVGQTVAASMSAPVLFVIAKDLSEMQVNASIDEADIGQIKPGQAVTFRVDAYPGDTFTGTVSQVRLAPVVAQNVVSYVTVIDVPNKELKLKPGMTATVTVEIARADNVLRVPSVALRFEPPADAVASPAEAAVPPADEADADGPSRARSGAGGFTPGAAAGRADGSRERGGVVGRPGRVWVLENGQLRAVRVRTGLTDGMTTAVLGDSLGDETEVVTGVAAARTTATSPSSSSPLIPQRPGGNRPGTTTRRQGTGR
jgi:HlyD family secretion protein